MMAAMIPTANRYAILPAFLAASTYVRPVPKMRAPAITIEGGSSPYCSIATTSSTSRTVE
jgi:hypothetical protein